MCHDKDVCGYARMCVCEGAMCIMIRMYVGR